MAGHGAGGVAYQLQDSQQPHQAQRRDGVAPERHQADGDDEEVEHVPAVREEVEGPVALRHHLNHDLKDEDPQDDGVQDPARSHTGSDKRGRGEGDGTGQRLVLRHSRAGAGTPAYARA